VKSYSNQNNFVVQIRGNIGVLFLFNLELETEFARTRAALRRTKTISDQNAIFVRHSELKEG
jgi:hypothetical protein